MEAEARKGRRILVSKSKALPVQPGILEIVVGEDERVFIIHESVLTRRSHFFKNAMSGSWKEAEDKVVKLPEENADTFARYEQLVYTGKVPGFDDTGDDSRYADIGIQHNQVICQDRNRCQEEYEIICHLYVLAEKLQDMKAKNTAVDALVFKYLHERDVMSGNASDATPPCLPMKGAVNIMYNNTPGFCPGRDALVDFYVWTVKTYGWAQSPWGDGEDVHQDFLHDLINKLMRIWAPSADADINFPRPYDRSDYYHEDEGEDYPKFLER